MVGVCGPEGCSVCGGPGMSNTETTPYFEYEFGCIRCGYWIHSVWSGNCAKWDERYNCEIERGEVKRTTEGNMIKYEAVMPDDISTAIYNEDSERARRILELLGKGKTIEVRKEET